MLENSSEHKLTKKNFKSPLISLVYLLTLIFLLMSLGSILTLAWFLPDLVLVYSIDKNAFYYSFSYLNQMLSSTTSALIVVFPIYLFLLFVVNKVEINNPLYRHNFFRKLFVILPIVLAVLFLTVYTIYIVYKILSFDHVVKLSDLVKYLLQLIVLVPVILYHTRLLGNKNLNINKS